MKPSEFPYDGDGICISCGTKWGTPPVGAHGRWPGKCSICGNEYDINSGGLAAVRDYGYLKTWYSRRPLLVYWIGPNGDSEIEELPVDCPECGTDLTAIGSMLFTITIKVPGTRVVDWDGGSYVDLPNLVEYLDSLHGMGSYDLAEEQVLDKVQCGNCDKVLYTARDLRL